MLDRSSNMKFACRVGDVAPSKPKIVQVGPMSIGIFELEGGYAAMLPRVHDHRIANRIGQLLCPRAPLHARCPRAEV